MKNLKSLFIILLNFFNFLFLVGGGGYLVCKLEHPKLNYFLTLISFDGILSGKITHKMNHEWHAICRNDYYSPENLFGGNTTGQIQRLCSKLNLTTSRIYKLNTSSIWWPCQSNSFGEIRTCFGGIIVGGLKTAFKIEYSNSENL